MSPDAPDEPPGVPPESARPATPDPLSERWARVREGFDEALELEPAGRAALLERLAAADPAVAAEVLSLLEAHERASGFLAKSPALPLAGAAAPGDRLGPYRLVTEIGRGGMGVVYRAIRDDGDFTREVAIKLIAPELRSEEILKRFRAERQILAMLEHPHIARLLDGGTAPDGSPYLVMEYVAGKSLLEYCDEKRLGVDARLQIFLSVCDAVQFAHQRLVVHRDLKADNILVGADGSPRLLDFGIAKLLAPDADGPAATVTAPMNRMLTPDYASPEQVLGEPASVSSDVYSLGVILYELLSGSRPLRFTTRTPEEILRVVTQVEPDPPSTVVTRSPGGQAAMERAETTSRLRRRLAGDLDYVILKALEKDAARRYGSVEQLGQDVRRHLEGLPVLARGQSTTYRISRFVRRHRVGVATTAVVALALIAGLAGTTWQASVARRERDRATRRFEDVRTLAHAVVFDLHDAIASLPGSTRARETLVRHALRYLDGLSRESSGDLGLQYELGLAYAKIGDVQGRPMFANLGQSAQALESYHKSLALLRGVATAWPESLGVVRDELITTQRLADLLRVMGRDREALSIASEAKQRLRAASARHPESHELLRDLGVSADRLFDMKLAAGDTTGALVEIREGLALVHQYTAAEPGDLRNQRALMIGELKLGELYAARTQRDSALDAYRRGKRIALELVREQPQDTEMARDLSIAYGLEGLLLADQGNIDSALVVYGHGQAIAEDLAARDPANALQQSDVAAGHFEIGTILMKGHRYREAEREFGDAYTRHSRLAAADSASVEPRVYVARSAQQAGEASRALAQRSSGAADRARWREHARTWLERSLAHFRALERAGQLPAEEAKSPQAVAEAIRSLQP